MGESLADVPKPAFGKPSRFTALRAIFKFQKLSDLIETEPQALRGPDEVQARELDLAVAPNAALRPLRFGHQTLALIEANRLNVDAGPLGERADLDARSV